MKKVIVIGCPGSGKSTFSRALHTCTELPLHHLDLLKWNHDRTTVNREVFIHRLNQVLNKEEWIIDGNYFSSMTQRMEACDTVIFLDYDLETCLSGIENRKGKPRPDMPWIEEAVDASFIAFIKNYEEDIKPVVMKLLECYSNKRIIIFKTRKEADDFLKKNMQLKE